MNFLGFSLEYFGFLFNNFPLLLWKAAAPQTIAVLLTHWQFLKT